MKKIILGGVMLALSGFAAHAQDYGYGGGGGYDEGGGYAPPPPPSYDYGRPPPPPPPRYGYNPPPQYGYGEPLRCRTVYTYDGPRRICRHY